MMTEKDFNRCLERKVITYDLAYDSEGLKMFFEKCGDYAGPFTKSFIIGDGELIGRCKLVDVNFVKNKITGKFFILNNENIQEPVLFDESLLVLEDTK